jgi:methylglutaconyl-CoA hydratase
MSKAIGLIMNLIKVDSSKRGISVLSLNRAEKRNALNIDLLQQLCHAIDQVHQNANQRVIILKGEGPAFCAGLDLAEANDESKIESSTQWVGRTLTRVYKSPLVTIAAVHGSAIAGGVGLMAACDLTIASEDTVFSFPETRRGLVAAQVMLFLVRQLKQRVVRELLLIGEPINAQKALSIGLINRIVDPSQLHFETYRLAKLSLKGAPKATAATKQLLDALYPSTFEMDLNQALELHRSIRHSEESKEGIAAFLEKRNPSWDFSEKIN